MRARLRVFIINANLTDPKFKMQVQPFEVIMPFCIRHMQCAYFSRRQSVFGTLILNLTNLQMEKNATANNRFVSHYWGLFLETVFFYFVVLIDVNLDIFFFLSRRIQSCFKLECHTKSNGFACLRWSNTTQKKEPSI